MGSVVGCLLAVLVLLVGGGVAYRVSRRPSPVAARAAAVSPPTVCAANPAGVQLLLVSIAKQRLWACRGQTVVKQSAVTTGMTVVRNGVDDRTPTGSWTIKAKYRDIHLRGSDANGAWDDYVQYWLPFDGAVGFHDASWQTFPFGSQQYHTAGSHACVHLPTDVAAWVYGWAPVGTTVTIET